MLSSAFAVVDLQLPSSHPATAVRVGTALASRTLSFEGKAPRLFAAQFHPRKGGVVPSRRVGF
jgi:hypothetical protein